ncbi:MAG: ATP-binding protein [Candidatus Contendobacter sp.]|nr:AAA family ATPase [Gammaproteobacteria bacterium]MCC8993117.1 ATP-binding protein [Candidatus Contendobacter sp.]
MDKTHYLPLLESAGRFLFLIRPRRFGKSLLQSVMECYYDAHWNQRFEELFAETWIAVQPTPEKGQYLTLRFDFSMVNPFCGLEASFDAHLRIRIDELLNRHADRIPTNEAAQIRAEANSHQRLQRLFSVLAQCQFPLYLFIDEYDNFANNLLVTNGEAAYRELTHGGGFFKTFFALLKGAAGGTSGGLARLFITGVSPLTMDDVTSGFNIGTNISLDPRFNGMLGFNHAEMDALFHTFGQDFSAHRTIIDEWYNHYHFHKARRESIVNSDMALYYLKSLVGIGAPPDELIDHNVRIDYGKLRHLVQIDRRLNGNFSRLREIIDTGEQVGVIQTSFPVEGLLRQENFISLLYYLGLLTFAGEQEGAPLLRIPNRTVQQLMYSYLREAYRDAEVFKPNTWDLAEKLRHMAYRGEWEAFFDELSAQIGQQASVRDYLQGKKMIQGFLLAWLNLSPYFTVWSEQEQGGGFVDLYLAPFYFRYPDMRHAYLIELKYLKRSEGSPEKRQEALEAGRQQLRRYAQDTRVRDALGEAQLHPLVLLYSGWELVWREETSATTT